MSTSTSFLISFALLLLPADSRKIIKYSDFLNNPYEALPVGGQCNGKVNEEIRQEFLDAHNSHRSRVARGLYHAKDKQLPPAADMIELRWSCDLERAAQKWADGCIWKHDMPLPLHSESLWRIWGPESYLQKFRIGVNATVRWAREFEDLGMNAEFHKIGHAMLMTYSDQYLMGCGYARCKGPTYNHLFAVCRYFSNGKRETGILYKEGQPTTGCPTGYSGNNDTALCEADDEFPVPKKLPVADDPFAMFKQCHKSRSACEKWKRWHRSRLQAKTHLQKKTPLAPLRKKPFPAFRRFWSARKQ